VACWTALDRLVRLAGRSEIAARDVGRWQAEAVAIRAWVEDNCWSHARRSYAFFAGSDDLDASVLLAARTGYVRADDPRFGQTIDAVRRELASGPLVYRYTGARECEGAFLACSFWLIDALARAGRHDEARQNWAEMVSSSPRRATWACSPRKSTLQAGSSAGTCPRPCPSWRC
jgi:pentatricopeptide repeat protein